DKSSQRPRRANSEKMTVQTMMGFVKRHPDEFAQSIELIRLAESIKRPGPRSGSAVFALHEAYTLAEKLRTGLGSQGSWMLKVFVPFGLTCRSDR
ncbi:unnamed protein product, partial [Symbiodinium microadriaticum]